MTWLDEQLLAWLDEQLSVDDSARLEATLRNDEELRNRLLLLIRNRDAGGRSLGEIWRRYRIGCPSPVQLARYHQQQTGGGLTDFIRFHLEEVGCRWCQAQLQTPLPSPERAEHLYRSSVGELTQPGE